MTDVNYRQLFVDSSSLLTLPEIAIKLIEVAQEPEPSYEELARLIKLDPSLSGRILNTVNSALFGLRGHINSVDEALPKLGLSLVRTLVLGFHLADSRHPADLKRPLEVFWRRCLAQATIAELLAEQDSGAESADYFIAGLIQDIGMLAMLTESSQEYLESVYWNGIQEADTINAEYARFGVTHPEVSMAIIKKWGLHSSIVTAIGRHHQKLTLSETQPGKSLSTALQAAALAAPLMDIRQPNSSLLTHLNEFLHANYGFEVDDTKELIEQSCRHVDDYASALSFDIGSSIESDRILSQAKQLLEELSIQAQCQLRQQSSRQNEQENPFESELYKDDLTGFLNRRFMIRKLNSFILNCVSKKESVSLMFIDIDKFKSINDTFGHAAGDEAIKQVANQIRRNIRDRDIAIRYGGDEFVLVLPGLREGAFAKVAKRLAKKPVSIELPENKNVDLTLSVGGSFVNAKNCHDLDPNQLVDRADQAMYCAKQQGGAMSEIHKFTAVALN